MDGINSADRGSCDGVRSGPGTPARSAAARLAEVWRGLVDESSMWGEEPKLTQAKADVRKFIRSLSVEGLLVLPYSVATDWLNAADVIDLFKNARKNGVVALFNLAPIEALARAQYDQARTTVSGIKLRLVSVSLETGETMSVDETGAIHKVGKLPLRPPAVSPAPPVDVVEGALASASMPGIFPARRLGDNMCVDGGVRDVVPVQAAVEDLGCNDVYAIRVSARPEPQMTDPGRTFGEVMARSVLDLTYDEIADDDVAPSGGWGEELRVTVIRPSFDLHDAMVVEPGLIRIAIDYGWMRAADVIDVSEADRGFARELSDRITRLRVSNWIAANFAAGTRYRDPHRGFLDFLLAGFSNQPYELQLTPTPEAVDDVRANCTAIRAALEQRLIIRAPTPPSAECTRWFTQWETVNPPPPSNDPWAEFHSVAGDRPAAQPPPPI
jgi:predicted acylesterase/phospholipase RssA